MPPKQTYSFQTSHLVTYGLQKLNPALPPSTLSGVRCLFCVYYGKEDISEEKHQGHKTKKNSQSEGV